MSISKQDETKKQNIDEKEESGKNRKESENLKKFKEEIEKYKKQAEENLNGWKRAKADFINYKKDQERWMEEFRKYANEDIITRLLQIVDGFHLAIEHLPEDLKNSDWAKGILCIKGQLESFLKEIGVEEIKSIGEKFDPNLFESVGEEESGGEEGIVICEIQKGYKMFGKVIRVSKVKISKKVDIKQESRKVINNNNKSMSKLYKCAKNCGSIEEMQDNKIPACCGCKMIEIKEEELFGCPGCAGCDLGCGKASGDNSK